MKRTDLGAATPTLVLNAAEGRLQAVLYQREAARDGDNCPGLPDILSAHDWAGQSRGVEILALGIRSALDTLGLSVECIGRIACVRGPGSFTGLRLCIATAQGLARGIGVAIGGLEYPALLARSAFLQVFGLPPASCPAAEDCAADRPATDTGATALPAPVCWVVTHARSNLVHIQGFALAPGQSALSPHIGRLCEIMVLQPQKAVDLICDYSAGRSVQPFAVGSGLARNGDVWRQSMSRLPGGFRLYFETHDSPSALALALEADGADYSAGDIAPLYVRPSDAEENIASIAAGLGLDPKAAERRLKTLTSGGL